MNTQQVQRSLSTDWLRLGADFSVRYFFDGQRFHSEWRPRMPRLSEYMELVDRYHAVFDQSNGDLFDAAIGRRQTTLAMEPRK